MFPRTESHAILSLIVQERDWNEMSEIEEKVRKFLGLDSIITINIDGDIHSEEYPFGSRYLDDATVKRVAKFLCTKGYAKCQPTKSTTSVESTMMAIV